MSRHRLVLATAATLVASVACSHQQEIKQTPKVATAAPPAPAPRPAKVSTPVAEEAPKNKEGDAIYFDFDSALQRDEARPVLQQVAESLQRRPASLRIEGNCDEVGTVEYNLALGDQRARVAREYLVHLGVSPNKIATVTYGAQRPKYPGHDDTSHARNRRDDFLIR